MQFIERAKQYPLVLWALALYLCSLGFNLKYDIPLIILLVTTIWAINRSGREQSAREFLLEHWHVISFVGLSIAITFLSEKPRYSVMAQAQFIPALLIYCAIVSAVDDIQKQRFVYIAVMVAGLIAGIFFVSEIFLIEHPDMMTRVKLSDNPLFIVPNDVLFLIAVSPLAWGVIFWEPKSMGSLRLVGWGFVVCSCVAAVYVQSRQAAGIFVLSVFLFFFLWRPLWGIVVGIVALMLMLSIDILLGGGLINKIQLFPRTYIWKAAWEMFLDNPVWGQGPGLFKHHYYEYLERAGYSFGLVEDRRLMNWAHSLYLEQLAERGVLGLLALVVLVGRPMILLGWKLWNEDLGAGVRKGVSSARNAAGRAGLLVAFLAFLLGGIAETSLLRMWGVVTLFMLVGLSYGELFLSKK